MDSSETPKWAPAYVQGNQGRAVVEFIEDGGGSLTDILFYCRGVGCAPDDVNVDECEWWPAYDFSTDYDTCCTTCGAVINKVEGDEASNAK